MQDQGQEIVRKRLRRRCGVKERLERDLDKARGDYHAAEDPGEKRYLAKVIKSHEREIKILQDKIQEAETFLESQG